VHFIGFVFAMHNLTTVWIQQKCPLRRVFLFAREQQPACYIYAEIDEYDAESRQLLAKQVEISLPIT
jgi:hypothetical protein